MIWVRTHKGDVRCRELADKHYTRQSPGAPMWTRPGYNAVLYAEEEGWRACWCWWRPKWEDGRPGTSRKDGLRVLECTIFRREGESAPLASVLIKSAVEALSTPEVRADLHLSAAGTITHLLTGVSSKQTRARRSKKALPGRCFQAAGWELIQGKRTTRADTWWRLPFPS